MENNMEKIKECIRHDEKRKVLIITEINPKTKCKECIHYDPEIEYCSMLDNLVESDNPSCFFFDYDPKKEKWRCDFDEG